MNNYYLISYIEDNDLGVYNKEILVRSESMTKAFAICIQHYPTMYGIKQMFGEIEERWKNYYTHESQDLLRRSQLQMVGELIKIFDEKGNELMLEKKVKEMLQPVGFKFKKAKHQFDMIKKDFKYDTWEIWLTYKGKTIHSAYVVNKGDFKEPRLELVLNSMFISYHASKNYDFFDLTNMVGKGMEGTQGILKFQESLKEGSDALEELFGDDFSNYESLFKLIRPAHLIMDAHKRVMDAESRRGGE